MPRKAHKKKNPPKSSPKNKKNVFAGLRQLFLPLLLLLLISLSLAATFYIIFLHTPPKSLP